MRNERRERERERERTKEEKPKRATRWRRSRNEKWKKGVPATFQTSALSCQWRPTDLPTFLLTTAAPASGQLQRGIRTLRVDQLFFLILAVFISSCVSPFFRFFFWPPLLLSSRFPLPPFHFDVPSFKKNPICFFFLFSLLPSLNLERIKISFADVVSSDFHNEVL